MRGFAFTSLFFLLNIFSASTQDSLNIQSSFHLESKGSGILVSGRDNFDCYNCFFETIKDNPIHHFAIYSGVLHELNINNKHTIQTGIYGEMRSYSGGSNTLKNLVVFPKILVSSKDTFDVAGQSFKYLLKGGDFWDENVNDIIRMYNVDYNGLYGTLSWKGFYLGFLVIGDLSYNVGYGLHQYHKLFLQKEFGENNLTTIAVSDNQLSDYDKSTNHTQPRDYNISINNAYDHLNKIKVSSQLEIRLNRDLGRSLAAAMEVSTKLKSVNLVTRLKYFQSAFNYGYRSDRPNYRGISSYVGTQLYPLKNYYRPYSQWASYTKQQNRDLLGLELQMNWNRKIYKKLGILSEIDLNIIGDPKRRTGETIPLYKLGFIMNFVDGFIGELGITNKHMNLDSFYQTVQASKEPFFFIAFNLAMRDV